MKKMHFSPRWRFREFYQRLFYRLEWRYSTERHDPYRCCECGSTDVEIKVWCKVNEGGRYSGDCEEYDRSYCNACDNHVRIRPTSMLLAKAEEWWDRMAAEKKRRAADYAGFPDKFWNGLSEEEKIELWLKH